MGSPTEKLYELTVVRWEGRIKCVYLNDYRIAGVKPWGGGETAGQWQISLKDLASAIPEINQSHSATSEAPFCWAPGQPLNIVRTDEPGHWSLDWMPDQVVYFAGWCWDYTERRANVCVSDTWPPGHNGDLTDGWNPDDLTAAKKVGQVEEAAS